MSHTMRRLAAGLSLLCVSLAAAAADDDEHIRAVVREMLAAKDARIEQLEGRVHELEQQLDRQGTPAVARVEPAQPAAPAPAAPPAVAELPSSAMAEGLALSAFFSVTGATENSSDSTYGFGPVEVHLDYELDENIAAALALVWDDGSSDIGVGFLDYHWFDSNIPARGRIFGAQGFHLQAGRFDLPFNFDYVYFGTPDRIGISRPLLTDRIQGGGFNGDGARVYGTHGMLNYAAYWTNSVYEDEGATAGGRIGLALGENRYRLHGGAEGPVLELGLSQLGDYDNGQHQRRRVYGADLALNLGRFRVESEWATARDEQPLIDLNGVDYGDPDEDAWHLTLACDFGEGLGWPARGFVRYDSWRPEADVTLDPDTFVAYRVEDLDQLVLGFNFAVRENVLLKLEYSDSLDTHTDEPDFEHRIGRAQVVASF